MAGPIQNPHSQPTKDMHHRGETGVVSYGKKDGDKSIKSIRDPWKIEKPLKAAEKGRVERQRVTADQLKISYVTAGQKFLYLWLRRPSWGTVTAPVTNIKYKWFDIGSLTFNWGCK